MFTKEVTFLLRLIFKYFLLLYFLKLRFYFHLIVDLTGIYTLLARVKVAFLAMVELVSHLSADLAFAVALKIGQSQLVFVVASF
jgi:hypothetical protein